MIIKYPENLFVICGAEIPEGRLECPKCNATEADMFEHPLIDDDRFHPLSMEARENALKIKDEVEQAFRQGYTAGVNAGYSSGLDEGYTAGAYRSSTKMYQLKADNERLKRENDVLRASLRVFGVNAEEDENENM